PVGGERTVRVRTRVVAATNRDLREAVDRGAFREDLFFRLGAFVIPIPPLRERREDIPAMAHEFLRRASARTGKTVRTISADAMTRLVRYDWPGNVRQLEHAIERAVILARGARIGVRDLPPGIARGLPSSGGETFDLRTNEQRLIREALAHFGGNRRRAAEALGISPVTLWRKLRDGS